MRLLWLRPAVRAPIWCSLPEIPFDVEKFYADVERIYKEKGKVIIAASEGIHDQDGKFISEYAGEAAKDAFGHTQMGGLAQVLQSS